MTAIKTIECAKELYLNEFENEFTPQSVSDWGDYLKEIDVSLKEDLPMDIAYFDSLAETYNISEMWKELSTSHPLKNSIQKCLDKLSPVHKQVVHLLFWEGLSLRATALKIKVSKKTVERYRDLALKKLHQEMSKHVPTNRESVSKILPPETVGS